MALILKNLCYSPFLNSINHSFQSKSLTLLIGNSGVGKSTLFRIITHLITSKYSGEVFVNDTEVSHLTIMERVQLIGLLFQNSTHQFTMGNLFEELVFTLENIGYPVQKMESRIDKVSQQCKVKDILHRPIHHLSGGEKQKAAFSILLAINPQVFLLDEPFASVDRKSRIELLSILKELVQNGKTIILCDHDLSDYEPLIDDVIRLNKGKIELLCKIPPSIPIKARSIEQNATPILFEIQKVTCSIKNKTLFSIPHFMFFEGISCITGENGIGKSTLFRSILQFQKYRGKILWNHSPLKKHAKLYQFITGVVQESEKQFIKPSVKEELKLDSFSDENQRIIDALTFFNLETVLDSSPYQLSGGQQKIIQLLVMLTTKASVILLDEPFVGLDDKACEYFCKWMAEDRKKGRSFLIISHRLSPLIPVVDYWIEMNASGLKHIKEFTISSSIVSHSRGFTEREN